MQNLLSNSLYDLRFALRQLRRAPGFALTAVLTLALGIGANTAIFSLLDQALLRSLPVRDPQQLTVLEATGQMWQGHFSSHGGDSEAYFTCPMYKDLRDSEQGRKQVFSGLLATSPASISLAYQGASQLVDAEIVSGNYFDLLGVRPALGRLFTQAEDQQKDAAPVAVLSFDFWKTHFASDPSLVGSTVSINGHPFQITGVASPHFHSAIWGQQPSLFVPMAMLDQIVPGRELSLTDHTDKWLNVIGRLQPGVTTSQAEAAMNPLWHALRAEELKALGKHSQRFTDDFYTNSRMHVLPGAKGFSYDREGFVKPLLAVMAMAALVLLIAVVNVASLLLVRSANRVREFSLRYALGAQPLRIVSQLLLEGLLIGVAGGVLGMAFAPVAVHGLIHRMTTGDGTVDFSTAIDPRVFVFNFVIALAVSVLFSLAPALQLRRSNLTAAMGQRTGTGSGAMLTFRRAVVCLQIGLSVLLLVGAGLFVRTMQKLRSADVGYPTAHLLTFGINPALAGYAKATVPQLDQRVLDAMAALPGVQSAALTSSPELAESDQFSNVTVAGYTPPPDDQFQAQVALISPAFFSTMRMPLIAGRAFTASDDTTHPPVTIVNESFAKHFCGSAQACLGRRMLQGADTSKAPNIEIVGVVHDAKHTNVRDPAIASFFRPLKQAGDSLQPFTFFYLLTSTGPAQMLTSVRRTMQQLDPALAIVSLRTMEAQVDDALVNERIVALLAASFGILATLLAGVGLYGVLAYSTAQRTREIGIRIALGSSRAAISGIVLSDVLRLAGIALVVSVPLALLLARLLRSQLFGVSPNDPVTLLAVVALIALVATGSALIPAARAASVNPTEALRSE